jgi:hypothetical protein
LGYEAPLRCLQGAAAAVFRISVISSDVVIELDATPDVVWEFS